MYFLKAVFVLQNMLTSNSVGLLACSHDCDRKPDSVRSVNDAGAYLARLGDS
jgi:hypothetical protein